jgi:hypothetical protein
VGKSGAPSSGYGFSSEPDTSGISTGKSTMHGING